MDNYEIIEYDFINDSGEWDTNTCIVYHDECFDNIEEPSEDES